MRSHAERQGFECAGPTTFRRRSGLERGPAAGLIAVTMQDIHASARAYGTWLKQGDFAASA
jgi:hypothetical protein